MAAWNVEGSSQKVQLTHGKLDGPLVMLPYRKLTEDHTDIQIVD